MNKKLFLIPIIGFSLFLVSCNEKNKTETTPTESVEDGIDLSNVKFESKDMVYDGQTHEILASNLPDGVYTKYESNQVKDAGVYYAKCFIYDVEDDTLLKELRAVVTVDNEVNEEYSEFSSEFFTMYLGNDYYSWNIFVDDDEALGFSREDAGTATFDRYYKITDSDREDILSDYNEIYTELKTFENASLSNSQVISYEIIENFCKHNLEFYSNENKEYNLMRLRFVDSFGGSVADFTSMIQNYHFNKEEDIIDIINYINSTSEVFPTYADYVSDRIENNVALSDTTLNEMIDYLDTITEAGDNYYVYDYLENVINSTTFIDDAKKDAYKIAIETALNNHFLPAVSNLSDLLEQYLGNLESADQGYFAKYGDKGKDLYKLMLDQRLGTDLDMEEYKKYLDTKVNEYNQLFTEVFNYINQLSYSKYNEAASYILGYKSYLDYDTIDNEMIDILKEFAKTIVPDLKSDPEIQLNVMDDISASVSTAVAYYLKSPVDLTSIEYITLNPLYTSDNLNSTFSTLAHEGYPGHLYAYVYAKENNLDNLTIINGNVGQAEGWANYVSLKLYEYIIDNCGDPTQPKSDPLTLACLYDYYNLLLNYLLNSRLDLGINYEGWSIQDTANYLNNTGFNGDAAENMYYMLIEMPTIYAPYGYGMSFVLDLHKDAEEELGIYYNEIDFNKNVILKDGEQGLKHLQELKDEYIERIKFINNIN